MSPLSLVTPCQFRPFSGCGVQVISGVGRRKQADKERKRPKSPPWSAAAPNTSRATSETGATSGAASPSTRPFASTTLVQSTPTISAMGVALRLPMLVILPSVCRDGPIRQRSPLSGWVRGVERWCPFVSNFDFFARFVLFLS